MLKSNKNKFLTVLAIVMMLLSLTGAACEGQSDSDRDTQESRQAATESLRDKQPIKTAEYSSTLDTINKWTERWGKKGMVSYVYMQTQNGTFAGYYVLKGLPVSYCTAGAPAYRIDSSSNGKVLVPIPGSDGAYYSNCAENRFYGFDAVTGQYIEYTDGMVLTAVLSDQPLALENQPPAYGSTIEEAKKKGG